jgi:DNA polymerase-3 subunit delta'
MQNIFGGTNPDFYEIITDKGSVGVDLIRDMQSDVANRPVYGKYKVYFIDNAEKMTIQAQNCLLKTLEEPPEYTIILISVTSF